MEKHLFAVVAGHICLDIIPDLSRVPAGKFLDLFQPGRLVNVGSPLFSTGGAVSNTGLALHILGIPTRLMGKVGDDLFGRAVLSLISRFSPELAQGMITDSNSSTSYTIIINAPGIDRIFLHDPAANDSFCSSDIPYQQLSETALFHLGYPPLMQHLYENGGSELADILSTAQSTGITTSLDMSFPDPASPSGQVDWQKIYSAALPHVDIFTPSIEELLFTLRPDEYQKLVLNGDILSQTTPESLSDISQEVLQYGVKIILIKLGNRGAYLRTADQNQLVKMGRLKPAHISEWDDIELWAPCFKVKVVGTTGSGDATIAGFLSGLWRGLSPEGALRAAVAVGACNVESADAIGGIQTWEKTLDRIQSGWESLDLEINAANWERNSKTNLWRKQP